MKSVKNQVYDHVRIQVWNQFSEQIKEKVTKHIHKNVWNEARIQVWIDLRELL